MDQAKKDDIRRRLKKVAALMASDNEHEAASAQRQAEAIMREYRMDQTDILIAEVELSEVTAGADRDPATWERVLASICAGGYCCDSIFTGRYGVRGTWTFVGMAPAATLAGYAFDALRAKHRGDRRRYIATSLKRFRNERNKVAAADPYSQGWVHAVRKLLPRQTPTAEQAEAIARFVEEKFGALGHMKPRRPAGRADDRHAIAGVDDGRRAELHAGVSHRGAPKMIEQD